MQTTLPHEHNCDLMANADRHIFLPLAVTTMWRTGTCVIVIQHSIYECDPLKTHLITNGA